MRALSISVYALVSSALLPFHTHSPHPSVSACSRRALFRRETSTGGVLFWSLWKVRRTASGAGVPAAQAGSSLQPGEAAEQQPSKGRPVIFEGRGSVVNTHCSHMPGSPVVTHSCTFFTAVSGFGSVYDFKRYAVLFIELGYEVQVYAEQCAGTQTTVDHWMNEARCSSSEDPNAVYSEC